MMINRYAQTAALFAAAMVFSASAVEAQSLGSFSWQLQPFCNYLTVTVTQQGSLYTLDGYDDQCGARKGRRSSGRRRSIPMGPSALVCTS